MSENKPEVDIKKVSEILEGTVYKVFDEAYSKIDSQKPWKVAKLREQLKAGITEIVQEKEWPIDHIRVDRYLWSVLGGYENGNDVTAERIDKYKHNMQLAVTKTELIGWYEREKAQEKRIADSNAATKNTIDHVVE